MVRIHCTIDMNQLLWHGLGRRAQWYLMDVRLGDGITRLTRGIPLEMWVISRRQRQLGGAMGGVCCRNLSASDRHGTVVMAKDRLSTAILGARMA